MRPGLIPQPDGLGQAIADSRQTPRLSGVAVIRDETENAFVSFIELNHAAPINILVSPLSEGSNATLQWDDTIPFIESPHIHRVQSDSHLLEPDKHTREESGEITLSLQHDGTQPSPTFMTMFETMPETQACIIATQYVTSWETECIPTLHTVFLGLESRKGQSHVLEIATKALAACQLSRHAFREQRSETRRLSLSRTAPDLNHEAFAHQFYGAALRMIRDWDPSSSIPPSMVLAVMVLFCCLESVMGNFEAFSLHSSGVQKMLDAEASSTREHDGPIANLLAAWTQAKMHNWWLRVHFSSPVMHCNGAALSLPREVLAEPQNHTRLIILHTLCEPYRVQHASLARLWYDVQTDDHSLSGNITWHFIGSDVLNGSLFPGLKSCGVALDSLTAIRRALDKWYSYLSAAEKPIDTMCGQCDVGSSNYDTLHIRPARFVTHQAAMNYAYYCAARVMNCSGAPGLPDGTHHHGINHDTDVDYWTIVLLQLAAGLHWPDCLRFNIHTIGIVSLLFACVLRTTNPAIGIWVEDWMSRRGVSEDTEEGSFPNLQILQALRLVNAERRAGRDVMAVYQPIDDGGGVGKYGSYTSQTITCFLVFGRCRGTGMLYSRYSAV